MAKPLDVWGIHHGREQRAIAAVKSRAEFVRLLGNGFSDHYVKNFGSTTGNPDEVAVARAMPGELLVCDAYGRGNLYTRQSDGARFTTIHEPGSRIHVYGLHEFKD